MSIIHKAIFKTRTVGETNVMEENATLRTAEEVENPEETVNEIIQAFNNSLRPGERQRELVEFIRVDTTEVPDIPDFDEDEDDFFDDDEDY